MATGLSKAFLITRIINKCYKISPVTKKNIMTSPARAKKLLDSLKDNPYFDKYSAAITKLQNTNPDEFIARIESKEKKEKKTSKMTERKFNEAVNVKPNLSPGMQKNNPRLGDVMKLELLENKGKQEIINIWLDYHKQKDCISGHLEPNVFDKMFERGIKYPVFVLPLPRENGYEFILIQFSGTQVHLTPLLWYQTHAENAPECLTLTYYPDLKESKGLILMKGEFDTKSINVQEAQCLVNELQLYYSQDHPERMKLLEIFTDKPNEFKHMELIKHLETLSI